MIDIRVLVIVVIYNSMEWIDRCLTSVRYCVSRGKASVMLAGVNVYSTGDRKLVPLGLQDRRSNVLPPFNEGHGPCLLQGISIVPLREV